MIVKERAGKSMKSKIIYVMEYISIEHWKLVDVYNTHACNRCMQIPGWKICQAQFEDLPLEWKLIQMLPRDIGQILLLYVMRDNHANFITNKGQSTSDCSFLITKCLIVILMTIQKNMQRIIIQSDSPLVNSMNDKMELCA